MTLQYSVPCLFGLEGIAANELRKMGLEDVRADNGKVRFTGGPEAMARANLRLRTGERVLLELGSFPAGTPDQLFEGTRALPWEDFIPLGGAFPVKGHSLSSAMHSVPTCQKLIKKAVATRLGSRYGRTQLPEDGALYQIQFAIMHDTATLYLDTTGAGLHKRGYRPAHNAAPLRETLAAALVEIARYRGKGDFCDPFCGSGTIPIEAALTAMNRAPGIDRSFSAQSWAWVDDRLWAREKEEARSREYRRDYPIFASDIDPQAVAIARQNARRAGVEQLIRFSVADARDFARPTEGGTLITNPPYGERLLDRQQAEEIYRAFGARDLTGWQVNLLSSHTEFERSFGRQADKRRKLYNGMIRCELYIYR